MAVFPALHVREVTGPMHGPMHGPVTGAAQVNEMHRMRPFLSQNAVYAKKSANPFQILQLLQHAHTGLTSKILTQGTEQTDLSGLLLVMP